MSKELELAVALASDLTGDDPNESNTPYELIAFVVVSTCGFVLLSLAAWAAMIGYGYRFVRQRLGKYATVHQHDRAAPMVAGLEAVEGAAVSSLPPPPPLHPPPPPPLHPPPPPPLVQSAMLPSATPPSYPSTAHALNQGGSMFGKDETTAASRAAAHGLGDEEEI